MGIFQRTKKRVHILWWRAIAKLLSLHTDNGCDNGPLALPFVLFSKIESKYFTAIFHLHVSLVRLTFYEFVEIN